MLRDEHVRWGHVAMNEAERRAAPIGQFVGVAEPLADLGCDVRGSGDREGPARVPHRGGDRLEVRAVNKLHDDEVGFITHADVEHLDAVGMRELGR
jgi:hypothetical protein